MGDPFSALASGVGIADVTLRLIVYLKDVKAAVQSIDDDIDQLINEVQALQSVHQQVEQEHDRHVNDATLSNQQKMLWFQTARTLKEGQTLTKKLEACVKEIYGDDPKVAGKRDGLVKQHRKRGMDGKLTALRNQIHTYHGALQIWLSIVALYSAHDRQEDTTKLLQELRAAISDIDQRIEDSQHASPLANVSALQKLSSSVNAVEQSLRHASTCKHFDTPHLVDPFYTGRDSEAARLAGWFFTEPASEPRQQKQKIFVVHGVGGSGKTQFCCKFALDNKERFWGIFWIDARSRERLKQTLSQNVARRAGVDLNEKAALHWLANLDERWLLLIDNADDPDIDLQDYLPRSDRGHVLVTTRNPANRYYGNVGPKFFQFQGLTSAEASSLLLKAAGKLDVKDKALEGLASQVSAALGCLALAIAVAGAAIREQFCRFEDYLDYHEEQRQLRPGRDESSTQTLSAEGAGSAKYGSVEATFDVSYNAIARRTSQDATDALQLLKAFAYLHCENIRFDFLELAVSNRPLETKQQIEDRKNNERVMPRVRAQTWTEWSNGMLTTVLAYLYQSRGLPPLPEVLRAGGEVLDKTRVRAAMRRLTQCSLVIYNHEKDSYSMHPLVHRWAREVPGMKIWEQGIWSEAAAELLSRCILLPPLGNTLQDEELRKDLLPHVDSVRCLQNTIRQRSEDKRQSRMKPWPVFEGGFTRERALMYAKFSIVYNHNGRWEDAKHLQTIVKDFTMKTYGIRHPVTQRITLALAGTLLLLGQCDDAAGLQEQVVNALHESYGPKHHGTLVAMQSLGECRHLQGRFSDARKIQEEALAGLEKLHGGEHADTLNSMDRLGCSIMSLYRPEDFVRARSLQQTAVSGMRKTHGPDHLRTLVACENLCSTAIHSGDKAHLQEALDMMTEVLEIRKIKLGREHNLTLLAMVNLALVKDGLGEHAEAEILISTALRVAKINLSADHIAVLWGQYHLGKTLAHLKRWEEAETLLVDVAERQKHVLQGRGRSRPDRVSALVQLAAVYNARGKHVDCDLVVEETLDILDSISPQEHPVAQKLRADREEWRRKRVAAAA